MTIAVQQAPLSERITAEAQQIRVGRALLDLLGAPFYVIGWLVFWVTLGSVAAGRWAFAGMRLGWKEARERAEARGLNVALRAGGRGSR